jgi:hypothetical protein
MKRSVHFGFFLAGFLLLTVSAQAGTVYFEGNCTWNVAHTSLSCVFDAQRPSNPSRCNDGSLPQQYFWNYGDGGSSGFTFNSFVSHIYTPPPPPGQYGYYVSLAIFCPEGSTSLQRYICVSGFGYPGCIFQDGNWY